MLPLSKEKLKLFVYINMIQTSKKSVGTPTSVTKKCLFVLYTHLNISNVSWDPPSVTKNFLSQKSDVELPKVYPPELYPGPTIQSRAQDLVQ